MKILIVDDSRVMRSIVKRALSGLDRVAGAEIVEAADGRAALEVIQNSRPDLVLSDWNMPAMTGIELLRTLNESGINLPFVFVTSECTTEMRELAQSQGACSLVTKPFTPESIDAALRTVL